MSHLDASVHHAAARIARLPRADGERVIVAVAGVPGSGKTTVASLLRAAVCEALCDEAACVAVPMDGFHYPKAALAKMPNPEEAFERRGAHWTFDAPALLAQLRRVKACAQGVAFPGFDHARGDPEEGAIPIPDACRVVVVEGNYLLYADEPVWRDISALCSYRIYVDCPLDVSTQRLTARHMAAWGISEAEARRRASGSDYQNALLIQTTRPQADYVIRNAAARVGKL